MIHNFFQQNLFPEMEEYRRELLSNVKRQWNTDKKKSFGIEHCSHTMFAGKYGIPKLGSYKDDLPDDFGSPDNVRGKH